MPAHHLVRVGALGQVGQFTAADATRYPRHTQVVLRTRRGLETGLVLAPCEPVGTQESDGTILRGMTDVDHLLKTRLQRNGRAAYESCVALLARRRIGATLLDVEPLFDGRRLFFYFLGDAPPEVEALTDELAEAYDARAGLRRFAETLTSGCGPDCGTENAEGGGCEGCTTCAVAGACGTTSARESRQPHKR